MIILLSPSKKLDIDVAVAHQIYSEPAFLGQSEKLINKLSKLSRKKISELMSLSASLADLNYNRYQNWTIQNTPNNSKQAIFAFKGDVYLGFDADTLKETDLDFTQQHVRILSGLYGILKPFDLIQAHRLEMGTRLPIARKKNLYEFWQKDIASYLNDTLKALDETVIINLASTEYFKAVDTKKVKSKVITCSFKENKDGVLKMIMIFVKQARGMMARYIIDNRISDPELIKGFNVGGYSYMENLSDEHHYCFVR